MTYLDHMIEAGGELRADGEKLMFPTYMYYKPVTLDYFFSDPFSWFLEKKCQLASLAQMFAATWTGQFWPWGHCNSCNCHLRMQKSWLSNLVAVYHSLQRGPSLIQDQLCSRYWSKQWTCLCHLESGWWPCVISFQFTLLTTSSIVHLLKSYFFWL